MWSATSFLSHTYVIPHKYRSIQHEVPVTQRRYGISAPSSVPAAATSLMENPKRKQHQKLSVVVSISRVRVTTTLQVMSTPFQQSIVYQHPEIMRRKQSMIKRSLIISAVNLCCNLPSHALRTIWTLDSAEQLIPERGFWRCTIHFKYIWIQGICWPWRPYPSCCISPSSLAMPFT
jgi:hypothetical protein